MMNCCGAAREGPLRWCAETGMQEMPLRLRAKNSQLSRHNHFIMETSFSSHLEGNFCQQMPIMDRPCLDEWLQCEPTESISFQPEMSQGVKPAETFPPRF